MMDFKELGLKIKLYNENCEQGLSRIADNSVDCVLTDPPYLYLKHKLDRPFDEEVVFNHFKRILKPTGFVVMFGRGTSFYRWNTMLADLGFEFKEEVIWNKRRNSSPLHSLSRVHETVSISGKKGAINRVKVPYLEMKGHDIESIIKDIKRLCVVFSNPREMEAVQDYLAGHYVYNTATRSKHCVTEARGVKHQKVNASVMKMITDGMNEKDVIHEGIDKYTAIHPPQKPVRLLERLLALVTKEGDVVVDPFSGSGSTAIACHNIGREFVGFEIDEEYFNGSVERIKKDCKVNLFS